MTRRNAKTTILGLAMLKHVLEQDAAPLYWTYIHHRGLELSRRAEKPSDLALLRLACNSRAQTADDLERLQDAWDHLTAQERAELTKHFLADGITTPAIVCEFLPLCWSELGPILLSQFERSCRSWSNYFRPFGRPPPKAVKLSLWTLQTSRPSSSWCKTATFFKHAWLEPL